MNKRKEFIDSIGIDVAKLRQHVADEEARKNEEIIQSINKQISLINNAYNLLIKEISELLEKYREAESVKYDDSFGNCVVYNTVSKSLIINIKFSKELHKMLESIDAYNSYTIPDEDKLLTKILTVFESVNIEYFDGTGVFELNLD